MSIDQRLPAHLKMKKLTKLFTLGLLLLSFAYAQAQEEQHHHDAGITAAPAPMSTGEVTKIDKEAGKITLRHGPLDNLGMPGMTMAFRVAQPGMLEQVKPGDKVRFVADRVGGALTVMTLQAAN
jgi:Cu/Ag efflux protein CusF